MGQSFITQGTSVICTNMTCIKPQKIGVTRAERYVMNTGKNEPLLNFDDKKISACFECKVPKSFWGGVIALCVGICIGIAITAAVVATGGAAAVALAAVAAAKCAVVVTGAVIAVSCIAYTINHDCDETLGCEWQNLHNEVFIEGKKALLNKSFMKCVKGGIINLIVDKEAAEEAAEYIAEQNENAVHAQWGSQLVQGGIMGIAGGLTGGLGYIDICIEIGTYCLSEYDSTSGDVLAVKGIASDAKTVNDKGKALKEANIIKDKAAREASNVSKHLNNKSSSKKMQGVAKTRANRARSKANNAEKVAKASKDAKINMGADCLNVLIDNVSNIYENDMADNASNKSESINNIDDMNAQMNEAFIGVISNNS